LAAARFDASDTPLFRRVGGDRRSGSRFLGLLVTDLFPEFGSSNDPNAAVFLTATVHNPATDVQCSDARTAGDPHGNTAMPSRRKREIPRFSACL
jgi:hypothetical protein